MHLQLGIFPWWRHAGFAHVNVGQITMSRHPSSQLHVRHVQPPSRLYRTFGRRYIGLVVLSLAYETGESYDLRDSLQSMATPSSALSAGRHAINV